MLVTGTVLVIVGLVGWLWMATRSLAHRRSTTRESLPVGAQRPGQ